MTTLEERFNTASWETIQALNAHYAECMVCQLTGKVCAIADAILDEGESQRKDESDG